MKISHDDFENILSDVLQIFLSSTMITPNWAKVDNQEKPIFRLWHMNCTRVSGNFSSETLCLGDTFTATTDIYPVVRLDGLIYVQFKADGILVTRKVGEAEAVITGVKRWFAINSAKSTILRKNLLVLRITSKHRYISQYLSKKYETIGEVNCQAIKIK